MVGTVIFEQRYIFAQMHSSRLENTAWLGPQIRGGGESLSCAVSMQYKQEYAGIKKISLSIFTGCFFV
jgi:hypothetical protein